MPFLQRDVFTLAGLQLRLPVVTRVTQLTNGSTPPSRVRSAEHPLAARTQGVFIPRCGTSLGRLERLDRETYAALRNRPRGKHMPRTLIVPVDGSDAAERAVHVAQRLVPQLDKCDLLIMTASGPDDKDRRDYLDNLVGQATVPGVRATFVEDPVPALAIARLAESMPNATVCMATHGRGRIATPFLGSVATAVLRQSTMPVLLVGPQCETAWWHSPAKLIACWSGGESDAVLTWSPRWADDLGAEFWLESVFHPLDLHMAANPDAEFEPALALLGPDVHAHLLPVRGDYPAGAIVQSARDLPATLLAMTTHARTGIADTTLGSVAMDVVHHSPCPVLVAHG